MSNFNWGIECVLHHEGGWFNHENDPGGATKFGISLRYLQARGDLDGDGLLDGDLDGDGDVDIDDIRALSLDETISLYKTGFWEPNHLTNVASELLAIKIFDMCVNMGSKQAWKLVQRSCNSLGHALSEDGVVGPATLSVVNSLRSTDYILLDKIRQAQASFYETLIEKKPSFESFRLGWLRRAAF